ncbi:MAG TPA: FecR domain-containing protein [Pyrinomonadaceae bacterium]|nr:FecR domain-containing protein [Pyrinomonadaceae bacterium]
MDNKNPRFYVDWWNIRKSTVYGAAAFVVLLALAAGGWWWLKNRSFQANDEKTSVPKDAARIISFEGDVRIVRASTRETILVTRETYVAAGDTIQTQADGRAQVKMIDGSILSVRPNSTVVIRDSASILGGTNIRVTLDDGQINVKTQDKNDGSENVVEMLESESELNAQTDASFNINPDAGGEIRISRGGVESNTGGEKVLINEGEYAAVKGGKISARERLLVAPKLVAPPASEQVTTATEISFRWQKPEASSAVSYRLQVAKSPFFAADSTAVERDGLTGQILNLPNFTPGVYYWRVRASTVSGQQSDWSEPRKFTIVKQSGGEEITAGEWQIERVGGNVYLIRGRTRAGTIVRLGDRETFAAADGTFTVQLSTAASNAAVDLSDDKGNRSRYNLSLSTGNAVRQN